MFIDEILEDSIIKNGEYCADAFRKVCEQKLDSTDCNFDSVRRIENGYQLFRRKHPQYREDLFRTYVRLCSQKLADALNW